MIISIDFDDTIVHSGLYPTILGLKENAKEVINGFYYDGNEILINTCRRDEFQAMAQEFLDSNGIKYHYINENLPRLIEAYKEDTRKLFSDIYIDDKNLGGIPDDWLEIQRMVMKHVLYPNT